LFHVVVKSLEFLRRGFDGRLGTLRLQERKSGVWFR